MDKMTWMKDERQCNFCFQFNPPSNIEVVLYEGREVVRVEYGCFNPDCPYPKILDGKTNKAAIYYTAHVELYRKALANLEKEKKSFSSKEEIVYSEAVKNEGDNKEN